MKTYIVGRDVRGRVPKENENVKPKKGQKGPKSGAKKGSMPKPKMPKKNGMPY